MNWFSSSFFKFNSSKKSTKPSKSIFKKNEITDREKRNIDTLLKELCRGDRNILMKFRMILEKRSKRTPCITVNKNDKRDGLFKIFRKKTCPHMAYCRQWRWPDLKNNEELRSTHLYCKKPFDFNLNEVCVNPYHYKRS